MSTIPPRNAPPKSKIPLILGLTVAGTAGYYFYSAGGDTKNAKLKAEEDFKRATGKGPGATERKLEKVGSEVDNTVEKAEGKYDAARDSLKEEGARISRKIDDVDRSVEAKAADAKAKTKGWFGW